MVTVVNEELLGKLNQRYDALNLILRGGIPIEGETEEDEQKARIVYDWIVRKRQEVIDQVHEELKSDAA